MPKSKTITSYFLLSCCFVQALFSAQPIACMALGIPVLSSKHPELSSPTYEKLLQGAGPATNDNDSKDDTAVSPNQEVNTPASSDSVNLSPLKLTDPTQTDPIQTVSKESNNNDSDTASGAVLKSSVSTTDYLPHGGDPQVLEAQSINTNKVNKKTHGHKKDMSKASLSEQAAAVKVGPLPLLESDNETQTKANTINDAEKAQITDLWEAALTRNPDIQFVIQKLQPTSNPAHLANILTRMLSTVAYGGLGAMSMMSPNMGTFAAASMGGSMMQTALGITQSKSDKRAKLTNEEQTIMYNMVRGTCDKLVSCYRSYKKYWNSLTRASGDLQDLQSMVAEARSGQDSSKQLEMEYTLRKQQRDMDAIADDLRGHRQSLIDLAGADAVNKLDQELLEERNKLAATDNQSSDQPAGGEPALAAQPQPNSTPLLTPLLKINSDLAQGDRAIKNIDSAESSEKTKTQTASTLSPQS